MNHESRNNVKHDSGEQAWNKTGACVALALAACTGMTYEQSTKWHFKHTNCGRKTRDGVEQVAGVRTSQNIAAYLTKLGRTNMKATLLGLNSAYLSQTWSYDADHTNEDEYKTRGYTDFGPRNMKVDTFAKRNPKGRFMLFVKGHGIACINGVVVNNGLERSTYSNQIVKWYLSFDS